VTHHFTPETENVEFYDVTKKKRFDGSHQQLEKTDLLPGKDKVSSVSCGI
jgi:hypothetical protein